MMRRIVSIFLFLFICCIVSAQGVAERLGEFIRNSEMFETSDVGVSVYNLTKDEPVYTYRDEKLCRPASVEKVITAITALGELGTDTFFRTRLAYTGNLTPQGVLAGDLYVVGGFDPEFSSDDMDLLVRAVADFGIRSVEGKLIADVSMTDSVFWGTGWAWDDTPQAFQPYLSPLMLDKGCVKVTVTPQKSGMRPSVEVTPASDYYAVDNRAESHHPHLSKLKITRDWVSNGNTIRISGNAAHRTVKSLNMYSSKDFFLRTFSYCLNRHGISVSQTGFSPCPADTVGFFCLDTPISDALECALKKSDNLSAEALFYLLAAKFAGKPEVGFLEGQKAIYHFMQHQIGKHPGRYKIVDGSGVSMYNYVTPALVMEYLKYAYRHPAIFHSFYSALPIAGVDGTLSFRMQKGNAFKNVHAKTGTVTGVSSLAGYVRNSNGDLLAFVLINQNVLEGKKARRFQDKFCEMLGKY